MSSERQHLSPILTEQEAVKWLRLDQAGVQHPTVSLKRLRDGGRLHTVRLGRRCFYPVACLEEFVRQEIGRDRSALR